MKIYHSVLIYLLKRAHKFFDAGRLITTKKLDSVTKESTDQPYQDLTPSSTVHNFEQYEGAIDFALKNREVKNLAITSPYGGGKSSFIKTFQHRYPSVKVLNISLASFSTTTENITKPQSEQDQKGGAKNAEPTDQKTDQKDTRQILDHKQIEFSILQQIFYSGADNKLEKSRFQRVKPEKKLLKFIAPPLGVAFLLALSVLITSGIFEDSYWWEKDTIKSYDHIQVISFVIVLLGAVLILYHARFFLRKISLKKVSVAGSELELGIDKSASVMNFYIDEIVYFFQTNPYDVVAIEDLDRFEHPDIFIKLREINILLNKSINRKIMFIYAIGDHIFQESTRTKFFDFIIPIIPIVSSSNATEVFLKALQQTVYKRSQQDAIETEDDKLLKRVAKRISLYITDMRMIKNIFNEYAVFENVLQGNTQRREKLLSIIAYKNLFPRDFENMYYKRGPVNEAFQNKLEIIASKRKNIEDEIDKINKRLEDVKSIYVKTTQLLRLEYIYRIAEQYPDHAFASLDNSTFEPIMKFAQESKFESFKKRGRLTSNKSDWGGYEGNSITFSEIENLVNPSETYEKRKATIEDGHEENINKWQAELEILHERNHKIDKMTLSELLKDDVIEADHFEEKMKLHPLLVYFLKNGLIDEDYPSIISIFHGWTLTKADREFVVNLKERGTNSPSTELKNIEEILGLLDVEDFVKPTILNYTLVEYFLTTNQEDIEGLSVAQCKKGIFQQLSNETNQSIQFVDEYITKKIRQPSKWILSITQSNDFWKDVAKNIQQRDMNLLRLFIRELVGEWMSIWDYCMDKYPDEKKDLYLKLILSFCDLDAVVKLDKTGTLSKYLANYNLNNLADANYSYYPKLKDLMKALDVKVKMVTSTNSDFVDTIYNGRHYQLNSENVKYFLTQYGGLTQSQISEVEKRQYSLIIESKARQLWQYILPNIDVYVGAILTLIQTNVLESEASIIRLLRNGRLSHENKIKIIESQDHKITDVNRVPTAYWQLIFEKNKIIPTWGNVYSFIEHFKVIDNVLNNYLSLSNNTNELIVDMTKSIDFDTQKEPILLLFQSDAIADDIYLKMAFATGLVDFIEDISLLSKEKIEGLIKSKVFGLNRNNYEALKGHKDFSHNSYIDLLAENKSDYLSQIGSYSMGKEGFVAILMLSQFQAAEKLTILQTLQPEAKKLNEVDVQMVLKAWGQPYSLLNLSTFQQSIPLQKETEYLDILKNIGAIWSYKIENSNIVIFNDSPLEIEKATYGASENRLFDVTDKIRGLIVNNKLQELAGNDIMGDPEENVAKKLTVTYRYKNESFTEVVDEGNTLILPK